MTSPKNKKLIEYRATFPKLERRAAYLLRDTMKVMGFSDVFASPTVALFYVDPEDPEAGGTGHTVRVCRHQGVPYVFQDVWMDWIESFNTN